MKKGFTLIELMVVVVIIGILAALAIPKFMGATDKAKLAEWKNVAKQITTLQNAYYQYHDTYAGDATLSNNVLASVGTGTWSAINGAAVSTGLGFSAPGGASRFNYATSTVTTAMAAAEAAVTFGDVTTGHLGAMTSDGQVKSDATTIATYVLNAK